MKEKICIWMNIPSHHQRDFFSALHSTTEIDLVVRYFKTIPKNRINMGWGTNIELMPYEKYVSQNLKSAFKTIPDWQDRVHIIPGLSVKFMKKVLDFLILNNARWIHWSERSGVNLANSVKFNSFIFNIFHPFFLYLRWYRYYAKKINKYALGAFAQGMLAKIDFIRWGISEDKIEYLCYNIKALKMPEELTNTTNNITDKFFCYLGALSHRKGVDILIKAFSNLKNCSNWKLLLVGPDESNNKYLRLAKKLNILEKIQFTGAISANHINQYIYKGDVFVFPTRFDGWGVVLNEAASLSKPIISSDQAGGAYHLVKDQKNGFIFKSKNVKELTKAMQYYVDNPEQIEEHGKESFRILSDFTPEKNVERLIKVIHKWKK